MLGREVLFLAARAEDGRGEPTVLVEVVRAHFGEPTVAAVGEAVHYGRLGSERLGELAPEVMATAEAGDAVAGRLVERLAEEVVLAALRALRDLELERADIVLGGGLLQRGEGLLHEQIVAWLAQRAPEATPVVASEPPVLGAGLEALDAAGAPAEAGRRLRAAVPRRAPTGGRAVTEIRVFADAHELGQALAGEVLAVYERSQGSFLLGCPGGRSLLSTYRALADRHADLSRLVVVMMDEYVDVAPDAHHSVRRFAREEVAGPLGVQADRVWLPDETEPERYDERIADAGGIDLFLLASGASDGHVAFVSPGSPRGGRTAVLELAESTRRDNLVTFPAFRVARRGADARRLGRPRHDLGSTVAPARAARRRQAPRRRSPPRARFVRSRLAGQHRPRARDAEVWLDRAALAPE